MKKGTSRLPLPGDTLFSPLATLFRGLEGDFGQQHDTTQTAGSTYNPATRGYYKTQHEVNAVAFNGYGIMCVCNAAIFTRRVRCSESATLPPLSSNTHRTTIPMAMYNGHYSCPPLSSAPPPCPHREFLGGQVSSAAYFPVQERCHGVGGVALVGVVLEDHAAMELGAVQDRVVSIRVVGVHCMCHICRHKEAGDCVRPIQNMHKQRQGRKGKREGDRDRQSQREEDETLG